MAACNTSSTTILPLAFNSLCLDAGRQNPLLLPEKKGGCSWSPTHLRRKRPHVLGKQHSIIRAMNSHFPFYYRFSVQPGKYFVTDTPDLRNVWAAPASTFKELVCLYIENPVKLPTDQATFLAMNESERWKQPSPSFIMPASFNASRCIQQKDQERHCNLVILEIDTRSDANLFMRNQGELANRLKAYNFCAYRSPFSTADNPCLIVLVEADNIPESRYASAAKTIARKLRLKHLDESCLRPSTPFPLPVIFGKHPSGISAPWMQ